MSPDEVRAEMAVDPYFAELADELKRRFAARLVWLKTGRIELGRPILHLPSPTISTEDVPAEYVEVIACPARSKRSV